MCEELTLLPCPACKNTNVVLRAYTRAYGFCTACGMCGPVSYTHLGYTNDRGEKVDKTEWHKVVFWDRQAETCSQYLAKGLSLIHI